VVPLLSLNELVDGAFAKPGGLDDVGVGEIGSLKDPSFLLMNLPVGVGSLIDLGESGSSPPSSISPVEYLLLRLALVEDI
jgi:hypothetical protein